MRAVTVSILSIFTCFSAFAGARLPIVNVSAGSVSARAAFGEKIEPVAVVAKSNAAAPTVVARAATPTVDSGEKIVHRGDVLTPNKPRSDLWARMEKPLRLPEPQEISVINYDYELPEENLDYEPVTASLAVDTPARVVARAGVTSAPQPRRIVAESGAMDAEIAKLVDLQRKADESVRVASTRRPGNISSYAASPSVAAVPAAREIPIAKNTDDGITVRRVVVPMEEDVIVRRVSTNDAPKLVSAEQDMSKMSPTELKKAFKKTYMSANKHLSTYKIDDRFDVASEPNVAIEGFTSSRDLSETGGVRPLEIKIGFRGDDAALSRDNYNLLSEYASIIVSNPKRAIQISIPQRATLNADDRKLAARRLAIVEQVLRDTGISDQRIMPVLAQRSDDSFVLRVISSDQFETLTQQKRDMFGDAVSKKTYKSMTW